MDNGVTIIDVDNTFIDSEVQIGIDTVIYPFTFIRGKTSIGESCEIGPQSELQNVKIGNNNKILMAVVNNSSVGNNVIINPFSHIGSKTIIKNNVRIGTGTVTCNFTDNGKSGIIINEEVCIGENSSLVAPVKIGRGVIINPGSIVNKNIPANSIFPPEKKKRLREEKS